MKNLFARIATALLLVFSVSFAPSFTSNAYAVPVAEDVPVETTPEEESTPDTSAEEGTTESEEDTAEDTDTEDTDAEDIDEEAVDDACREATGSISWIVCPTSGVIAGAIDALYNAIEDLLVVQPVQASNDSPIYLVWQYARGITNIVFIIFLLIVIYSQLTGLGINNYGVKRVLPRLIIAIVLVNLSYLICSLAVDVSNIVGSSLRSFLGGIENDLILNAGPGINPVDFSFSNIFSLVISGGAIGAFVIGAVGGASYIFFMLLIVLIGAIIAVAAGLITIAARQALVSLLIMIAPLAFVAYLLPNTEKWFEKWRQLFTRMLVFYPLFSFLFGASQLLGFALIISAISTGASSMVILGLAVQVFPLFASWSLMKMSGTVLESVNSGIRKLADPIRRGTSGWALGHAEQNRQRFIANSSSTSARLRRYLDYRHELRDLDTKNSMQIRQGKASERALTTASSSLERDHSGNLAWSRRANRFTRNAKRASIYDTRLQTSTMNYKNTLGSMTEAFGSDHNASILSNAHSEAVLDNTAEMYRTANVAEADQTWLLNQYLDAAGKRDSYQFNRLIKSANGGLGHLGEDSIMGQVIVGNSAIENRRRTEARIMITKFGVDKRQFRGMTFDSAYINDNGYCTDEFENVIEDDQYNLLPGKHYTPWQHYIGVHKKTGKEISKAEYDALSNSERDDYRRVRYMDIIDKSTGNVVQRIHYDDAGYMKELLGDDINIGDPINERYLTQIGARELADGSLKVGALYKYHSTISAAMLTSKYKEHNGAFTPMLVAQANSGNIADVGMLNIAEIQSINVAAKPGSLLINDGIFLNKWCNMLATMIEDEDLDPSDPNAAKLLKERAKLREEGKLKDFSYYFPDESIQEYFNVNTETLKGYDEQRDADGNVVGWTEIGHKEMRNKPATEQLRLRKNYLKHNILVKFAQKLIGSANRRTSPNVSENQKPDTLKALINLATTLKYLGLANANPDRPFETKLDGNKNLFDTADPGALQNIILEAQRAIEKQNSGSSDSGSSAPSGTNPSNGVSDLRGALQQLSAALGRFSDYEDRQSTAQDSTTLIMTVQDFIGDNFTNLQTAVYTIRDLVLGSIDANDPRHAEIDSIVTRYEYLTPSSTEDSINLKDRLCQEIVDYLQNFGYSD